MHPGPMLALENQADILSFLHQQMNFTPLQSTQLSEGGVILQTENKFRTIMYDQSWSSSKFPAPAKQKLFNI